MEDKKLVYDLLYNFIDLKKYKFCYIDNEYSLTHTENMILFIIKNLSKNNKISLSVIRDKIKLAPSTITPVITSLENKELIERKIDENDRRNIYIYLSDKGKKFTQKVDRKIKDILCEYIEYMGKEDVNEIIRLIKKTKEYINVKKGDK